MQPTIIPSKGKNLTIPVNREDFIKQYLLLWKGYLNLTQSEITVLDELISSFNSSFLISSNKDLSFIEVFSKENRKFISEKLKLTNFAFNNIFMRLKNRGIIVKTKYGYEVSSRIMPVETVTFNFKII